MSAITLPDIREETLGNGLRVVVARRPGVPLVAARLAIRAGSALDPAGGFGLAHLATLAARRGAGRRTGRAIDDLVESAGASLGGAADEDATVFGLSAPVEAVSTLLGALADVAARPTFPVAEVERLRRSERAELAHDADEGSTVADRALLPGVYGRHPYGHPVEGKGRDLARLRRKDLVAFQARHARPSVALLVVAGPVDPDATLALARRHLGAWRGEKGVAPGAGPAERRPRQVVVVDKPDATQVQVRIGGVAIPRRSPDFFPAMVGNTALGGGFTSRLVEAIRVNRGLTYGVRSRFSVGRDAGFFAVSSFTKNESVSELVSVAFDEMARYAAEGPTADELSRASAWLAGLFPLSLETHDQWADRIADAWIHDYPLEEVREYQDRIRAVTREEARAATARHLPLADGVVLAVGPAEPLRAQLERFGPLAIWPVGRVM